MRSLTGLMVLFLLLAPGCEAKDDEEPDCCDQENRPWMCTWDTGGSPFDGEFGAGDRSCQGDDASDFMDDEEGSSRIVECQADGSLKVIETCETIYTRSWHKGCQQSRADLAPSCETFDHYG